MNIICTQENLKAGLNIVGRIISTNNTLPILNNILVKTENGQLKISSTNLEIGITTNIRCKIEEEGAISVVNKTFSDLINNLPNKNLTLKTQNNQLLVETENYHTAIKTLPAEEFPLIPSQELGLNFTINAADFKAALDRVVFAASANQTQPEISGILFVKGKDMVRVAATDRYRLAEKKISFSGQESGELEVILPQKTAVEISRIIGAQKGQLEIVNSPTQIFINFNETHLVSRVVDGQYPDYKQIIPNTFTTEVVTKREGLIGALKTVSVFSRTNNSVKIDIGPEKQELVLKAESSELGSSAVELSAEVGGPAVSLFLNYHYLLDCLSAMDSEDVIVKIIDDSSPTLFLPKGDDNYMCLVMPIKS